MISLERTLQASDTVNSNLTPFPRLTADLLLVHAPAFFDFRERKDIYFPFLWTSGDVPITPLYEYFPVGFKTLERFLSSQGHAVKILNLGTILLRYPATNVDDLIEAFDAPLVGIDLHWMVHVQGSLVLAKRIKQIRPDLRIIFGGISSIYYANELIQYDFVDMVMRGYDTHVPMAALLDAVKSGRKPHGIANLPWKSPNGEIEDNGVSHVPDTYACGIDWSRQPKESEAQSLSILELLSTQNASCSYNCGWCGGSREAFRRIFRKQRAMARKPLDEIQYEFETIARVPNLERYHFYSVGSYNESKTGMNHFLDRVAESGFKSISYE